MVLSKKTVIISKAAMASIKDIYDYIKEKEKSTIPAKYVKNAILNKCKSLKDFSGYSIEAFLSEYSETYRSVSIWNYLIIFTENNNTINILSVIHTSRHPEIRKKID